MEIYRGTIDLLDYVFYSTTERGKVYETGAFVHNYALAYALGLVRSETYTYAHLEQKPHYVEELTPLNETLYLTPGAPAQVAAYRLLQWNTLREGYGLPDKKRSVGYPDWGLALMLRPDCRFIFYLLLPDLSALPEAPALHGLVAGHTIRVRLGKFSGKVCLRAQRADKVVMQKGPFQTTAMLNWRDLETDPVACDIAVAGLPTRLLSRAHFEGEPYYEAYFGDDVVRLPGRMRFLARLPEVGHRAGSRR